MFEMYTWIWQARSAISLLLAFCILAQSLLLALSVYKQPRGKRWFAEVGLETALLLYILICSMLHGQMMHAYEVTLTISAGYAILRIVTFGLVVLMSVSASLLTRRPWALFNILVTCIMLPGIEQLLGNNFSYTYVAALLILLVRSILLCVKRYHDIRTGISSRFIKNAIDYLHAGILFYEPDGFVLLSNKCMRQLMIALSGRIQRNGKYFYELLCTEAMQNNSTKTELEGQTVYLLPDGKAWMFTKSEISVSGKEYIQLTAIDITERWQLTAKLQQQTVHLRHRSEELAEALEALHVLSREKETQNAKIRVHDILGQRLTLLLRTLRNKFEPSPETINYLSEGLMEELAAVKKEVLPSDAFDNLREVFAAIGVDLQYSGSLPDGESGRLLVEILRESATNAVRHGFATQIQAQLEVSDNVYRAYITNNGSAPSGTIIEGGGLGGIRNKLKTHGGTLDIQTQPHFALTIHLPGGSINV